MIVQPIKGGILTRQEGTKAQIGTAEDFRSLELNPYHLIGIPDQENRDRILRKFFIQF